VSDVDCFVGVGLSSFEEDFFICGGSASVIRFLFFYFCDDFLSKLFLINESINIGSNCEERAKKLIPGEFLI
jgi:hypothetical protein